MKRSGNVRRRTAEERLRLLSEYEFSGKTQRSFCEGVGLSLATLSAWLRCKREMDTEADPKGRLIEVAMASPRGAEVVVEVGDQIRMRASDKVAAKWLAELLLVLRCGD